MNEHWTDRMACRELIERSARCVDDGDARAFAELFTENAILVRPSGQALQGREAIFQTYAGRPPERITRHLVCNVVITLDAIDRASARSDVLFWSGSANAADSPSGRPADARQLVGAFADTLVRGTDGGWRIQRREASFVLYSA
ncbi:hypothetical protein MASR1M6_36220 [Rubrivivax sp.]|jgi:uncharacterized protein (TIGR02246 family)